jgi:hypothetical protein
MPRCLRNPGSLYSFSPCTLGLRREGEGQGRTSRELNKTAPRIPWGRPTHMRFRVVLTTVAWGSSRVLSLLCVLARRSRKQGGPCFVTYVALNHPDEQDMAPGPVPCPGLVRLLGIGWRWARAEDGTDKPKPRGHRVVVRPHWPGRLPRANGTRCWVRSGVGSAKGTRHRASVGSSSKSNK